MSELVTLDFEEDIEEASEINDEDGRHILVEAVLKLAVRARERHGVRLFLGSGTSPLDEASSLTGPKLWLLAELLCILIVLNEADSVSEREVSNLRGTVSHPVRFTRNGQKRLLWIQHNMLGRQSGFMWRPDLAITEDRTTSTVPDVLEIIECKHHRKLSAATIRSEFAKGFDLEAPAYLIWSYFKVSERLREGAERLGIRLAPIGFADVSRAPMQDPDELISHLSAEMRSTREDNPFATALTRSAATASDKASRERLLR